MQRVGRLWKHSSGLAEGVLPDAYDRVTVFATYRCNLRCGYCRTIHRPGAREIGDLDLHRFRSLLDSFGRRPVRHIHFTGGEATLVADLPRQIGLATERGIPTSLTTNGTAPPEFYDRLVAAGLHEVRLSYDSHRPEMADRLAGRAGVHARVERALVALVRSRAEHGLRLILNVCVGEANRAEVDETVLRLADRGVDDVKLLGVIQERETLPGFAARARVLERLEEFVAALPPDRFPLLRRKLRTVFSPQSAGLEDLASRRLFVHCFVPLTERTVDARDFYPCPVIAREGGEPLGALGPGGEEERQSRAWSFARSDRCREDPICRAGCIYCLKRYNLEANAVLRGTVRLQDGEEEPIHARLRVARPVPAEQVRRVAGQLASERSAWIETSGRPEIPFRPFLAVKPSGLPFREQIRARLAGEGIRVSDVTAIPDWNELAMRVYSEPLTEARVERGLVLAQVLPGVEGGSAGELWWLREPLSPERLNEVKREIRAALPPVHYLIDHGEDLSLTAPGYVHTPDVRTWPHEMAVLAASLRS